jgi:hypothetical protein
MHHHFSASLGDLIAVAALALAWLTFRLDRAASDHGEARAATALLRGVREGFFRTVGDLYFSQVYTAAVAKQRARSAAGGLDHVFVLPTEPVAALIADQRAVAAGLISPDTVVRGTVALWQISKINELVREQATFNAMYAPDFADKSLPLDRQAAVLEAGLESPISCTVRASETHATAGTSHLRTPWTRTCGLWSPAGVGGARFSETQRSFPVIYGARRFDGGGRRVRKLDLAGVHHFE